MQAHQEICTSRTWLQVAVFLSLFLVAKQDFSPFECYLIRNVAEKETTGSGLKPERNQALEFFARAPDGGVGPGKIRDLELQPPRELCTPSEPQISSATDLNCSQISPNIYAAMVVDVTIFESVKLQVLQNISETVTFIWLLKKNNISSVVNGSGNSSHICLDLVRATGKQAGTYELIIQSKNSNFSIYFEVKVRSSPRKPYFTFKSDYVSCFSEGYPKPVVYWMSCDSPDNRWKNKIDFVPVPESNKYGNIQVGVSLPVSELMEKNIQCCADNALGTECSRLYTIDLTSNKSHPEIFLKTGEAFVIRCWARYESYEYKIKWDVKTGQQKPTYNGSTYCPMPIMVRILLASLSGRISRNITCTSSVHPTKSISLKVIDRGFIDMNTSSVQRDLNESKVAECLVAEFTAYPAVRCAWIHKSNVSPCLITTDENGQSKSEYCDHENTPGEYMFYVENDDMQLIKTFTVNILKKPEVECKMLNPKRVSCKSHGYPLPTWLWRKSDGGATCKMEIKTGITIGPPERDGHNWMSTSTLDVDNQEERVTICICAVNSVGETCTEVLFTHLEKSNLILPIVTGLCGLAFAILIALLMSKYKKRYKYESQLQMMQFIGPSDNEYIYIDFRVLPYDVKKWEFPRENLEFGNTIGSGAFGKVVTATAYGICKSGESLQVAVKMLKENPDTAEKDALMSELKMMTQVGHHDNIVNLLGACTTSGPIYLIFEYCPHGDLLNYLKGRRDSFHKTWSDVVKDNNFTFYHNFNQDEKFRDRSVTVLSNRSYTWVTTEQERAKNQHNQDLLATQLEVLQTEEVKYQNTKKYDEEDLNILTLEDLLNFSYQVAQGMEFLESKLCIHRDLAARNILINKGKVAKICDFGLARDIVNDSNYVVKGNARLPVKWMAPESIFDGMYTIKSDVWSYGILLWEIFSLGINPYPGIPVDAKFYKLLQSGFKMDQPFYATDEIYFLMKSCWAFDSKKRPSFSELVSYLGYQISNTEALIYQNQDDCDAKDCCMTSIESALIEDLLSVNTPLI
ncbi:receptor-type tyrosine-protein kinase FLT3 [Leptodactylus fuscus]|uniref:receptor-type tyrosine-protein kinase FLT3 n=1 Tax=Leptodactylus fuscus TaxID=238119 RepID=UPI003F4F098C